MFIYMENFMHNYVPCSTLARNCNNSLFGLHWTIYRAFRKDECAPPLPPKFINPTKSMPSFPGSDCRRPYHSVMKILNTTYKTPCLVSHFILFVATDLHKAKSASVKCLS